MNKVLLIILFFLFSLFYFSLNKKGEVYAEGKRGYVKIFSQNGYVELSGKGKLWLKTGRDAQVIFEGKYDSKERDGLKELYKGFEGKVVVKGFNFRIEFRGEKIKIHCVGMGKIVANGEGKTITETSTTDWGKEYKWSRVRY